MPTLKQNGQGTSPPIPNCMHVRSETIFHAVHISSMTNENILDNDFMKSSQKLSLPQVRPQFPLMFSTIGHSTG